MLHRIFLATTFLAAAPLWAAEVTVQAPVSAVTIFPQGAEVMRAVTVDLPAGQHRILIPLASRDARTDPPRVDAHTGATVGAVSLLTDAVIDPRGADLPEQAAARQAVDDAQASVDALYDQLERERAMLQADEAKLDFLRSVTAAGFDTPDADGIIALSDRLATAFGSVMRAISDRRPVIHDLEDQIGVAKMRMDQARRDLDRLSPAAEPVHLLAISIDKASDGPVDLTLTGFVQDAGWAPGYDMHLDRAAGRIAVDRKLQVGQSSGEPWINVALTLSTADPNAQIIPSDPRQSRAVIRDKLTPKRALTGSAPEYDRIEMPAVVALAEPVIEEAAQVLADLRVDGLSVSYTYPDRVTIPSADDLLQLALDSFTLDAEQTIRATPRDDDTAFLLAEFRNTQPDPMLPGDVSLYRDGAFIGRGSLPLVPAGAEETVAFGALDGIRLDWRLLENNTGDTGIIASRNRRIQSMEFSVENLTGTDADVLTLFAMPFSEQEDLKLNASAKPAPDVMDYEKDRGIGAWDFALKPGQKRTVRVDVDITWPENKDLLWRP